jgi:hypothetical protein
MTAASTYAQTLMSAGGHDRDGSEVTTSRRAFIRNDVGRHEWSRHPALVAAPHVTDDREARRDIVVQGSNDARQIRARRWRTPYRTQRRRPLPDA